MARDRERRLTKLEEDAQGAQQPPAGRRRPSDQEEALALREGLESWMDLMRGCGWSEDEIEEDLRWTHIVDQRCRDAGYESWMVVGDMEKFMAAGHDLDDYPGPDHWERGEGGPYGPMPVQ